MAGKKAKEKRSSFGLREGFVALVFILEIILIFTFLDYIVHTLRPEFAVSSQYFINKIIYGTIIGFLTYIFIRKKPILQKSLILSAVVSILLQIRYTITGYALDFVLLFLVIHFIILFVVSYVGFRVADM